MPGLSYMIRLKAEPTIHADCDIKDSVLGIYTEIGEHSSIIESQVGDYTYCAGSNQIIYAQIGPFCSIATGVRINPGNHPTYTRVAQHHFTYRSSRYQLAEDDDAAFFDWRRSQPVIIGPDVWIGHNAIIMPGVRIGIGAVIGSAAVVTHDVEDYTIVAGVPAHPIKRRFSKMVAEALTRTRWWEWNHEILRERLQEFCDIENFIRRYDPEVTS